jgi:hypothetical protein
MPEKREEDAAEQIKGVERGWARKTRDQCCVYVQCGVAVRVVVG